MFRDTLKKEIKTGQPPYTMTLQNHKNVNFWGQKVAEIVVKLGYEGGGLAKFFIFHSYSEKKVFFLVASHFRFRISH